MNFKANKFFATLMIYSRNKVKVLEILIFKTIHIIGFTAWFAGLYFFIRMLAYQTEALQHSAESEISSARYGNIARKVYKGICNPAMLITWIAGLAMLYYHGTHWLIKNPWMHIKLLMVLLLTGYHLYCFSLAKKLQKGNPKLSASSMHRLAAVAAVFLIILVILGVFRDLTLVVYALGVALGLIILVILISKIFGSKTNEYK